ncbi:hypothetical protein IC229_22990 [Spirosoma sp. BT702]|uniref:Neutral/alkaline non-lysosomal ceramidase N-terminal domain-containing protein n=1 Tax=Spirosoma profusum TaxID=2771354 RepID=A0A927ATH5_9BACT|nr:hypothetical protein [Spirosoma profusum]MBD2703530.1 hypothetical protein [Spirosoma profusum]
MTQFQAGAARVETTPPLGTRINGDFITHYATYIHDDLYAKALVLKRNDTFVAIVVVDICVMTQDFLDVVKAEILAKTGIPVANVLISSTHTHAAGSVADVHLGSMDPAYRKKLPSLIVKSVELALRRLKPAQIAFGSVDAPEHVLCRRYKMAADYPLPNPVSDGFDQVKTNPFGAESLIEAGNAPTDPELSYLAVKGLDNSWISILGNYSLHYVGDWEDGTISADYFGVFSNTLAELLQTDDQFVGMMSNGTSGDVNIWDFLGTKDYPNQLFEKSKLIGSDLAKRVVESVSSLQWQTNSELKSLYDLVDVATSKPSADELQRARQIVSTSRYETIIPNQEGLRQIYAREQLLLNEYPDQQKAPVQAIKIGTGLIGALAGEFFSETGLYLKKQLKGKSYFTISLANGNVGYVPPASEMAKGGYETWRCRCSCLVSGSEEQIREHLLKLLQQL